MGFVEVLSWEVLDDVEVLFAYEEGLDYGAEGQELEWRWRGCRRHVCDMDEVGLGDR